MVQSCQYLAKALVKIVPLVIRDCTPYVFYVLRIHDSTVSTKVTFVTPDAQISARSFVHLNLIEVRSSY